jgi:hypothetical protein
MARQIILVSLLASAVFCLPIENREDDEIQKSFELAGLFEGDIALTDEQRLALDSKNGLVNERYRWPNRIVPYFIPAGHFCK